MALIRFFTAGESHGPKLTAIIEGLPSGFIIDKEKINIDLARRRQGFGRGGRMKIESDELHITAGVVNGKTTGAPVALEILNDDYKSWQTKDIEPMTTPRPGHADFAGTFKYDHDDIRLTLERASARETAARVAVGSIAKQILGEFQISIHAYVTQIGTIHWENHGILKDQDYRRLYDISLANEFAFPDDRFLEKIKAEINAAMHAKDTLGGVFETVALGLIPGLGSHVHYDRKLDGRLALAMMSIPAMKAVEIGDAIKNAALRGTQVHDELILEGDKILRRSNRAGGLEGGMTNGMPLVVRTYMKPISTTLTPRQSVDLAKEKPSLTVYERSDFCAVPRAVVIGEAMMALVLLDALKEKIGGDHKKEMLNNFNHAYAGKLQEVSLLNAPWRFNYDR